MRAGLLAPRRKDERDRRSGHGETGQGAPQKGIRQQGGDRRTWMVEEHSEETSGDHEDSEFRRFHGVFGPMLGEGRRSEVKRRTVRRRGRSFRDLWRSHFIHASHGHGIRENAGSDREFFWQKQGSRRWRPNSWEGGLRCNLVRYEPDRTFRAAPASPNSVGTRAYMESQISRMMSK